MKSPKFKPGDIVRDILDYDPIVLKQKTELENLKIVERRDEHGRECYIVEKLDGSEFLAKNFENNHQHYYDCTWLRLQMKKPEL